MAKGPYLYLVSLQAAGNLLNFFHQMMQEFPTLLGGTL